MMSHTSIELVSPSPAASGSIIVSPVFELHENFRGSGIRLSNKHTLTRIGDNGPQSPSRAKSALLILAISSIIFIGSLLPDILPVGLPRIARDVELQENLLLW